MSGHLCAIGVCFMTLLSSHIPKAAAGLGKRCLVRVALPAACSCCGGRGPAGAHWRPGRWSSLQHFSCLDTGTH